MQRHPRYTRDRIAQVGGRIRDLIHADVRDPDSLRVAGPVDRIAAQDADELEYRDAGLGERFGPLWATYWFRVEATVPEEWAGERVDLLWVSHSEATLWIGGRPVQGLNSSPEGARVDAPVLEPAAGGERLDVRVELACNGKFGELRGPTRRSSRSCSIAAGSPASTAGRGTCTTTSTSSAGSRRTPSNGLDESWAGRLLSELNRFCNVWVEHDRSTWDEAEAILTALLAQPKRLARPRDLGDRPRPYRHRVAVAAGRDAAQAGAHLQLADRLHGALPGVPVRLLAGPAVRLDPHAEPRPVRAHPPARRGRQVAARRRHVGRAGLQPAVGRVARPPVPARPAVLRARAWPPLPRVLEPGRVRLQRPAPADHARRRDRPLPDPEALVEPVQPAAAPHVHVAGDRRLGGARPLPARRHLQRDRRGRRAPPERARLQGSRPLGAQPAPVRLRRRRRRADAGDARDAAARARPPGRAAHVDDVLRRVLRRARGGRQGAPDHRRRAVLRVPPRHVHDPGRGQAREPGGGAGAARRRPPGGARRAHGRRGASRRPAGRAVAAPAPEPVPRHPAGVEHRARVRGRRPRPRRGARRCRRHRGGRAGGAGGAGRRLDAVQHDRLRRGPRWPPGRTASRSGSRRRRTGSASSSRRRPGPSRPRSPGTESCSRTASCGPSWAATASFARWWSSGPDARRSPGRGTCSRSTTTTRRRSMRGTSTRSIWRRSPTARPRRHASSDRPGRCGPRWRSSGRSGGPARCGRSCASTRARGGSNSTARSTGASRTRC